MIWVVLPQSLSYWLYLLLFYYLVLDLRLNRINVIDERGSAVLGFEKVWKYLI